MEKPLQGRGDTGQQSWPNGHSSVACIEGVPSARGHRGPSVTQEPWLSWPEPQYPATVPPTKQSRSLGTPSGPGAAQAAPGPQWQSGEERGPHHKAEAARPSRPGGAGRAERRTEVGRGSPALGHGCHSL